MEDKILKQIEEEALKLYPVIMHSDSVFESERDIHEFQRHFWTEGAKFGYNIKESVDEKLDELLPAVENIIYRSLQDLLTDSNTERSDCAAIDVIDYLKLHLSASKNTVSNEGEKWVSVEDGFPFIKNGCDVIVLAFYPENNTSFNATFDGRFYPDNEMALGEPTHWMPLPKNPKLK